jgi:hypothetical protein
MQHNKTTHILLGIIAVILAILVVVLVMGARSGTQQDEISMETPQSVTTAPGDTAPTGVVEPKHPPAPGPFNANAVTNFHSSYNAATRTFTITANVGIGMFFEANTVVALYDQDANLIQSKGVMPTGTYDMYNSATPPVPVAFTFTLPAGESPTQPFIVRIIQDDPSGDGSATYWGTVITGN